jgi:glycosyltransferase involved in cell wall biosynthesis
MRVLIVAHGFPPKASGGAELYAQAHAGALTAGGDRVFVLTREADRSRGEFAVRREHREGLELAWINNTFASVRSFADTYTDDRVDRIAADLIDEFKPDVAHVHHLTGLSTTVVRELVVRNVPVLHTLHDYWLLCHRGQLLDRNLRPCANPASCQACLGPEAAASSAAFAGRAAVRPIVRYVPDPILSSMRSAAMKLTGLTSRPDRQRDPAVARREHMAHVMGLVTHFFAPSRYLQDRFVAAGVDPERISVSEYGWALPNPPAADAPVGASRPSVPLRVGFIGSLMVSKAPHLLIEACAGLPSGSCVVHIFGDHAGYHGDASYRERLQPLLAYPNVLYHGRLQRDQLASALGSMDVLVVPSIWPENSPLVIREAFMAGVPVIASRIGGIPETVADGAGGLLFSPGDAGDLRRVLRRLIDEQELLPRLRAAIPAVRTIPDDVTSMRSRYETSLATPPKRRRLAAIVLNYHTPEDTFLATRSLLLSGRPIDHVIVVDNSDEDDSSSRRPSARRSCEETL